MIILLISQLPAFVRRAGTAMRLVAGAVTLVSQALAPAFAGSDTAHAAHLRLGDRTSEKAHQVKTVGSVKAETLETEMGGYRDRYRVRTLSGENAELRFEVPLPAAGQPLLLEIQEIHTRRPVVFGYTVLVNDQPVYFRTYEEYGAGPNHLWVAVDARHLTEPNRARITLRNAGSGTFSVGQVWAYGDFFTRVEAREDVYRTMGVLGQKLPAVSPRPTFRQYGPIGNFTIGQYGSQPPEQVREKVETALRQDAASATTSMIMLNGTVWGGKPSGPDGQGGYFSDPRYSLLGYDADKKQYLPSWPNMWSNTAWPTLRDDWMNAFLEKRFVRAASGLNTQLDLLRARGTPADFVFVREWGPVLGEITNDTITEAARDGVTLDPADGLDGKERLWLYRDGVHTWEKYARSSRAQFGRDSVQVDRGTVTLPQSQVLDNLFAHPDFLTDFPMEHPQWSAGQTAMVPGLWSSGEMGQGKEYREIAIYDYLRGRGRLAMINMERPILKENFQVLRDHYARGFQFVTLFNDKVGDERFIAAIDDTDDQPALPPVHREPAMLWVDYAHGRRLGPPSQIASMRNVELQHATAFRVEQTRAPRLAIVDPKAPGEITYRLENGGQAFTAGLNLHLDGRISAGEGNRIELWTGPSPDRLTQVRVLTTADLPCPDHWTPRMTSERSFDLGTAMVGQKACYLRLVVHAASARDAAILYKLSVGSAWPRSSGYVQGEPLTIRQQRITQLWVQDRALAENLMQAYAQAALDRVKKPVPADHLRAEALLAKHARVLGRELALYRQAADLCARGWYRQAYRLLCGEISQILPVRYAVRGHGQLGTYPVEVRLPNADAVALVTLRAVGSDRVEFSLASDVAGQRIGLAFAGLEARKGWRVQTLAPNHYAVVPSASAGAGASEAIVDSGRVSVELAITPPPSDKPTLPRTLVGRFLSGNAQRLTLDTQNLEAMSYGQSLTLAVVPEARFTRRADGADPTQSKPDRPEPFDRVEVTLNDADKVVAVVATHGQGRGRIKAFHAPVLVGQRSVGGIELEDGRRFDFNYDKFLGTSFETTALRGSIVAYELPMLAQALQPGQEIVFTYTPTTHPDTPPRLRRVTQTYRELFAEDFTKTQGEEWKTRAQTVSGVAVTLHKAEPNYQFRTAVRFLRPTAAFQPGHVIYTISSDRPLGVTAVEFTARAFEDSSAVVFSVSRDGQTWTPCGRFDNSWLNPIPQSLTDLPPQTVDLTPAVRGAQTFYLKVELAVHDADERFCFGRLRVLTEDQPTP
jgi:hypothetical protein